MKSLNASLRRREKNNQRFIYSEEGKTSAEFLQLFVLGAGTVASCAIAGGKTGATIGPQGAPYGAAVGAAVGLIGFCMATHFYYSVRMNKDKSVTVDFVRI